MKIKKIFSLIILLCSLSLSSIFNFNSVLKASNLYEYNGKGYCQDFAGILSQNDVSILNATLKRIEKESSIEISTVSIPTLDGDNIENYANKLFRYWGIGKTTNNGVLFIIAMSERKTRIEVGRGLEPYLTDVKCDRILNQIKPYLKSKDYNGAFNYVINSVNAIVKEAKEDNDITYKDANVTAVVPLMTGDKNKLSEPFDWNNFLNILLIISVIGAIVYIIYQLIIEFKKFNEIVEVHMNNLYNKCKLVQDKLFYINSSNNKLYPKNRIDNVIDKALSTANEFERNKNSLKDIADKLQYYHSKKTKDNFFDTINNTIANINEFNNSINNIDKILLDIVKKVEKEKADEQLENELLVRAKNILSKYSVDKLNNRYFENKKEFEAISNEAFIKKPNYSKHIDDIQLTIKTITDAKQLSDYRKGVFNSDLLKYIETLDNNIQIVGTALYNAKALLKDTEIAIKNITSKYNTIKSEFWYSATEIRRALAIKCEYYYKEALFEFDNKNLKNCNDYIKKLSDAINKINKDYQSELEVKEVIKTIKNYKPTVINLINSKNNRINYLEQSEDDYKNAKLLENAHLYPDAVEKFKSSLNLLQKIETDYSNEQAEIKRKEQDRLRKIREQEEEEERRRRRKREEEEEDDRRRRNSYSSSSYDYSSSSSDSSNSSFGGGDSGGGGASGSFD